MNTRSSHAVLFTAGAAFLALIALGGFRMVAASRSPPCGDRNANSVAFHLEHGGRLFNAAELSERVGYTAVGLENLDVMRPRDTRTPAALQINLRNAPATAAHVTEAKAGVAFSWEPRSIRTQAAACLSYKVFFEGDLDFQVGGILPGIEGQDLSQQSNDNFVARVAWLEDGRPGVALSLTASGIKQTMHLESQLRFPRAQWIRIDKEVTLNTPGQNDGILRVWIDGLLAIERRDVIYRQKPEVTMSGVQAKVSYGSNDEIAWAPADTTIWISSFEISWQ
jgi:hypothetical protein